MAYGLLGRWSIDRTALENLFLVSGRMAFNIGSGAFVSFLRYA